MRIDLDGVDLRDGSGRIIAIFRFRTTEGLILRLPESTDVNVPWSLVDDATIDLAHARVMILFKPEAPAVLRWLKQQTALQGSWTDRRLLESAP